MICSQYHASAALQRSLIGLPLTDAESADRSCQTWLHAWVLSCNLQSSHLSDNISVNMAFGLLVGNIEVSDVQVTRALPALLHPLVSSSMVLLLF